MAPRTRRAGWIDWRNARARAIILQDLEPGGVLVDMDHLDAELIFDYYKEMPEFEKVAFDQFEARLAAHRVQSGKARLMARRDAEAVARDNTIHPRQLHNSRGEPVFDMHPAKRLLRMDVNSGLHDIFGPAALRQKRPAYRIFKLEIFKNRIYQEVCRQKFLHFLALKRAKTTPAPRGSKVKFHASHLEKQLARRGPPRGPPHGPPHGPPRGPPRGPRPMFTIP
jgi:hypothetical protein